MRDDQPGLLLGGDEQVLSDWLCSHPGVQIFSRDRGAGYRKAIQRATPQVNHVLDRWHVLKNLGEVIQKTLAQQIDILRQAGKPGEEEHPAGVLSSSSPSLHDVLEEHSTRGLH